MSLRKISAGRFNTAARSLSLKLEVITLHLLLLFYRFGNKPTSIKELSYYILKR